MRTTTFRRRHHPRSGLDPWSGAGTRGLSVSGWKRLAFLLLGALVLTVGSIKVTEAHHRERPHRKIVHSARHQSRWAPSRVSRREPHRARHRHARPVRHASFHSPATPGVAYRKQAVGSITAHVVQVDLNRGDVQVTVGVANGGVGHNERWSAIINRLRPTAAITGTYYDPATFIPVSTIIANGVDVHGGTVGTALVCSTGNHVRFIRGRLMVPPAELRTVLRAGPRLVDQGRVSLMPWVEGFRDPSILVRKPRAAVGLTRANKLLLVTVTRPVYLREMAKVMQGLGAVDAMCMDGGSSTGLYYAGKSYQVPRRVMTNLLVVYAKPRAAAGANGKKA